MPNYFESLEAQVNAKNSLLCVGLDPHTADLKEQTGEAAFQFCKSIVDATTAYAVSYKPNAAFFEALGPQGVEALEKLIKYIPNEIPVLLDAKRGDISSTAEAYAKAAFDVLDAQAVTIHPYMGSDSVVPFTKYSDRGVFVLCKTSNPSSNEFETLNVQGKQLYEIVAEKCESWNQETNNVGIVVGATDVVALTNARKSAPSVWILAPGVGFQGGNLSEAVAAGLREDGSGLLVPVTRGISRAEDPAKAAEKLRDEINVVRAKLNEPAAKKAKTSEIKAYQREFFKLAIDCGVLKFGSFTLKSGRQSPYFFNAGNFASGMALHKLGNYYAKAIHESGIEYDLLFGPAYKGIPLVAVISSAMYTLYGKDIPIAYNRKEKKDHGEGGVLVGQSLKGKKILVIDDTITAGTAIRESISMIQKEEGIMSGVIVALDRQETRSEDSDASAIQAIEKEFGVKVCSIVGLTHLLKYSQEEGSIDEQYVSKISEYRQKYGVEK